jgi:hypothetical protein
MKVESDTRGFCEIEHWTEPSRYQAHVVVERYGQTGVSENAVADVPLLFGENAGISIPAHMTAYELIFRSITGQVERRAAGQASPLFQTQLIEEGDTDRLLVSATPPRLN